jgi:hypothetical protein
VSPHNPVALPLFLISAAYLAFHWRDRGIGPLRFSLAAIAVMVLASCFTITTLGPKHLVILLPFLTVIVAASIGKAWSQRGRRGSLAVLVLLIAMAAAQFAADLGNDRRYLRSLAATGGVGLFSSAHGDLASYLVANGIAHPLAGDWGFDSNLEVLSQGRVRVRQIFEVTEALPYPFTREQAREALSSPESVFLFHAAPISAAPGRFEAVAAVAREMGVGLSLAATFRDRRGQPVALVYRPSTTGSAGSLPRPGDGT